MSKFNKIFKVALILATVLATFPQLNAMAAQPKPRVINGRPALPGEFPWMAALVASSVEDSTEAQFCGATLIAGKWLLTAAHCVSSLYGSASPTDVEALVGIKRLPFGRGDRKKIIGIVVNPSFNAVTLEHDFALLKLEESIPGPYAQPAGAADADFYNTGVTATVTGWGQTDVSLPILPVDLLKGTMTALSDADCLSKLGRYFKPLTMLCAKPYDLATGNDACYGDSGGPLVVTVGDYTKQVGVVSWGFGCDMKTPGVFSEVRSEERFIQSFPTIAPSTTGLATIQGNPVVGSILTCVAPTFKGDPAVNLYFYWYSFTGGVLDAKTNPTYLVKNSDAQSYLYCMVEASNAGGTGYAYSDFVYISPAVVPASYETIPTTSPVPIALPTEQLVSSAAPITTQTATQIATSTPEPTATVNTTLVDSKKPTDTTSPTSSLKKFQTNSKYYHLLVDANDDSGAMSVSTVTVSVVRTVSKSCNRSNKNKTCLKRMKPVETLAKLSSKGWISKVARTAKDQKLQFTIRALDSAGNWQNPSTVFNFKLK